jgi:hypothetical protein
MFASANDKSVTKNRGVSKVAKKEIVVAYYAVKECPMHLVTVK